MRTYFLIGLTLFAGVGFADDIPEGRPAAVAHLFNPQGQAVGEVRLVETKLELQKAEHEVELTIEITKLPPGLHAFEFHEVAACQAPGFESAGEWFEPSGAIRTLEVPESGEATAVRTVGLTNLDIVSERSLLQKSIVIYSRADGGQRIACGVIESTRDSHTLFPSE